MLGAEGGHAADFTWEQTDADRCRAGVLVRCAGVGWMERASLEAWFYLRSLARADEANQALWVGRVAGLDGAALPGLVDLLTQDDPARASMPKRRCQWFASAGTRMTRGARI